MFKSILLAALVVIGQFHQSAALFPFKLVHNASHAIPLTPDEWAQEFECAGDILSNDTSQSLPLECYRDRNAWLYKHIDELQDDFKFLVHQDSIDARFADSVFLTNGHTGLDLHHYKFNSGDPEQDAINRQVAGTAGVDASACRRHLRQMLDTLDDLSMRVERLRSHNETARGLEEAHFRLARILDSFGRYESGQLGGRYHSFGLYDQCIGTPLLVGSGTHRELVGSRYCWARLGLDKHLSRPLRGVPHGSTASISSYFPGDFKYHMAVCLPKSCHSSTFGADNETTQENLRLVQRLVDSQLKMPRSMYLDESLPLESIFCLVDDDSPIAKMSLSGKLFFAFALGWVLLCVFVTFKRRAKHDLALDDLRLSSAKTNKSIWSSFDLFDSWFEFLGERETSRLGERVNLDPLNFVKWFCTILVVMSHATVLSGPLTLAHIRLSAFMETNRFESLSVFGFVLVDSFFVITGMMMTYIFLRRARSYERRKMAQLQKQPQLPLATSTRTSALAINFEREFSPLGKTFHKACMMITLTRYLRLVPLFFLAFWFKKSVYPYLGSGPMWDYGLNMNTTIGGCQRETWLTPFTFLSAYLPGNKQCLPQTWTISNDLFFSIVMPPIIVMLYKWPRTAFALSGLNVILSLYWGKVTYYQLDARARFEIEQLRDHSVVIMFQLASYIYSMPLYRMPAIIVGTLTGYVLFKYSQQGTVANAPGPLLETSNAGNGQIKPAGKLRNDGRWPAWFRGPLTYFCLTIVVLVLISSLLTPEFRRYASPSLKRSMVIYMLLYYHLIWSLSNAVLFLRLVTDWNEHFLLRMAASKFFSTAGKLSYAILLVHWDLLIFDIHIETQAIEFSRWNYFGSMALAYLAAVPVALVVFVVFENPMDKLVKRYLPRV